MSEIVPCELAHSCSMQSCGQLPQSLDCPSVPGIVTTLRPRKLGHGEEGAADKAECLTGCKSLYRQLPVFGRLAYPGRAAATKHERLGRKSPSCPAAVLAAVGTIRGRANLEAGTL